MTSLAEQFYTLSEAAVLADRSKTVVRRWITEGWIPDDAVLITPGRNGVWLIQRSVFDHRLPEILSQMAERKGGRGRRATDAQGNTRGD